MVNHYYIYAVDRDFGPFFLKFSSYFPYNAKLCQIRSTLHLNEIMVSPSLFEEVEGRSDVERLSHPLPLEFSADGELLTRV